MTVILFVAIAIFSSHVFADVVVFEKYKTTFTMDGDKLKVYKKLRLMNIGSNPIIPGEIHFKLSKQEGNEIIPVEISDLAIIDHYDREMTSNLNKGSKETDIIFTIWEPLLPKFFYDFTITYKIDFEPKGLLFYEINIPEEKTTIKIKQKETEFLLPKKFHVTYAPDATVDVKDKSRVIQWATSSNQNFEYSLIPLPKIGVRMVNIFWILLISICLLYLVTRFIKTRKSVDY